MIKIKTKKTVINEEIAKVKKKRWNAYYFVGNLAALWCKGFSHYFDGGGGEKQRNFADLRKVGLDTSQSKGLKWREKPASLWEVELMETIE
ncbi:hypothetical protein FHK94_13220 [Cylindrospermopsis raciborskii CS-506_D]|nr:hypothetical protein [Cylindrospermopsis raciborskii CS-506_D]